MEARDVAGIGFFGEGNALVVPVFNIRALVIPTVGFSLKNTTLPRAIAQDKRGHGTTAVH